MTKLQGLLGADVPVHFAGNVPMIYTEKFKHLRDRIHFTGKFSDLDVLLNQYRVGILPTRIAAGIPLKAFDFASRGVPTVCTNIVATQMGWQNNEHALVTDWTDPGLFARQCAELYTNKEIWEKLRHGLQTKQTELSKEKPLRDKLHEILALNLTTNK
jgi:glycosyltransferase involved in cell wall biosynthesis